MIYNKKRYKELLIRIEELKNQGKSFYHENPDELLELLDYKMAIEEQVFWANREEFLLIMKKKKDLNLLRAGLN